MSATNNGYKVVAHSPESNASLEIHSTRVNKGKYFYSGLKVVKGYFVSHEARNQLKKDALYHLHLRIFNFHYQLKDSKPLS